MMPDLSMRRTAPISLAPNVELYAPIAHLSRKALVPGDTDASLRLVARAEAALEQLSEDFTEWMGVESDRLLRVRDDFAKNPRDSALRQELYRAVHDIRANATGFGFPLASRIATSLALMLEKVDNVPELVINRHVAAIRAVVREDMRNADHPAAKAVAQEFERIVGQMTDGGRSATDR